MKRRKLNKRGKILLTSLTIMLSVVIYVLMVILGEKGQDSIFTLVALFSGWSWLLLLQPSIYFAIWKDEVNM